MGQKTDHSIISEVPKDKLVDPGSPLIELSGKEGLEQVKGLMAYLVLLISVRKGQRVLRLKSL